MNLNKEITKQIKSIIDKLIKSSLNVDYNYVSDKNGIISWENYKNISFTLKNEPYEYIYNECLSQRAFTIKLFDGALLQFMYEFKRNEIISHRLAYYPNPERVKFVDDPLNYEQNHYGDQLFSDNYEKGIVVFPVRFDFDNDIKKYKEHYHSYSHLTLGNYSGSRTPVSKPLSPYKFTLFILRNFYFERFIQSHKITDFDCKLSFDSCISIDEEKYLHISI